MLSGLSTQSGTNRRIAGGKDYVIKFHVIKFVKDEKLIESIKKFPCFNNLELCGHVGTYNIS